MSKSIELKTIYDLLGLNFFVPSYQRGYRWIEQQVKDLLQDIYDFAYREKEKGEFYCLQPIVVKQCDADFVQRYCLSSELDDNQWYEVIDGQQRLTTLHILLSYFERHLGEASLKTEYGREKFVIEYETRRLTRPYLENITSNYGNIDCEYIFHAYQTIDNWFANQSQPRKARCIFMNTLLEEDVAKNPVQVIWYELPTQGLSDRDSRALAIDSFTRLNIGKIPLTNAELVKALFLQKRNFEDGEADLRQIEIAKEWDQMESALQEKGFWAFLNKDENDSPVRIEFLFDTMYQIEKSKMGDSDAEKEYGNDQYATFRFFNKKFTAEPSYDTVLTVWKEVKDYFNTFRDWYEENEWYHYVGYLIWEGTHSIQDIYSKYIKSNKSEFKTKLKTWAKESLENIKYTETEDGQCYFTNTYEHTNKRDLRALFLLYNIEFILQKKAFYYRFPFDLFKSEKWDIEHISSQTENTLNDKKSQEEWLYEAVKALGEKDRQDYEDAMQNVQSFQEKRKWIINRVGEDAIDEELKNSIGNLTLLNAGLNKSYGNNIFPVKRKTIVDWDKDGAFILLCTKNTFLKYNTDGNNLRWTEEDILRSMNHIVEVLKDYITKTES